MTERLKKLWAAALTSGKYKQGKNCLTNRETKSVTNCCLGVLYHVVNGRHAGDGSESLSARMLKRVGMTSEEAVIFEQLNDVKNWNFKQIARYVLRKEWRRDVLNETRTSKTID